MNQNKMNPKRWSRKPLVTAITASLALAAGAAPALEVTGSFTGWWDQPDQRNHGLILTVSTLPDGAKTGAAFWAHFNEIGQPSWLFAQGPIVGNTIEAELYAIDGVSFMEAKSVEKTPAVAIGTMDISFSDCNGGDVAFSTTDTEIGSGYFKINRLTSQPGVRCTGGISDDRSPSARPKVFEIELAPTTPYEGQAEGKARFKDTPDESEFEVEIEVAEEGTYFLFVQSHENGEPAVDLNGDPVMVERGEIIAARRGAGGPHPDRGSCSGCHSSYQPAKAQGEIKFSSPNYGDEKPLDFDLPGSLIEVRLEDDVVLVGLVDEEGAVIGMGTDDVPDFGDQKIKIHFSNEFGEAEAELDPHDDEVEFEIEIEDVQPGSYSVSIDGTPVLNGDDIPVVLTVPNGQDEGELEFRFPPEVGTLPLNFDPRGKTIEISDGTAGFTFEFPLEATEDESDDDDNEDGSSDDDDDEDGSSDDDDDNDGSSDDDDDNDGSSDDDDDNEDGSSDDDDDNDGSSDDDDDNDGSSDDDDDNDGGSDDDDDDDGDDDDDEDDEEDEDEDEDDEDDDEDDDDE